MIDYYARVARRDPPPPSRPAADPEALPERRRRGLLLREALPEAHGRTGSRRRRLWSGRNEGDIDYCLCNDRATLIWMAQLAALELHPSLSLATHDRAPDRPRLRPRSRQAGGHPRLLPGRASPARAVRRARPGVLPEDLGVEGAPGLPAAERRGHLRARRSPSPRPWRRRSSAPSPKRVVSRMAKKLRRGKVFVDWSQNDQHKTTVAVYSLRARERPTVSTPLELGGGRGRRRGRRPEGAQLRGVRGA